MNAFFAFAHRLRARMRLWLAEPEPGVRAAIVGLVLLGLFLRCRAFLWAAPPLWRDEASWAMHLVEGRYGDDNLRPLGFMAVASVLVRVFGAWEGVLRALPWAAGIVTTLLAPLLARRLFTGAGARLFFVAVLALHPGAIDLAKEFKPYSISLALHTGLLVATFRYLEQRSHRSLLLVLGLGVVATLFAQDSVFAYPAIYAVLAWDTFRNRRAHLRWVLIGAGATVLVLATQYILVWSRIPPDESAYWGNKYDVFHTDGTGEPYFPWSFGRYRSILEFPGLRQKFFTGDLFEEMRWFRQLDRMFWSLAHAVGLVSLLLRRKFIIAALLGSPCLVLWVFNALDIWPMGAFRTNLFSIVYMTGIAAAAFDGDWKGTRRIATLVPVLAMVLLPFVFLQQHFHASKLALTYNGYLPRALTRLETMRANERRVQREVLLLSERMCAQWDYYTGLHPRPTRLAQKALRRYETRCVADADLTQALDEAAGRSARVWVLLQHGKFDTKDLESAAKPKGLVAVKRATAGRIEIAAFRRSRF